MEPAKQMKLIGTVNGDETPLNAFYSKFSSITQLSDVLKLWRTNYNYEMDGVIVTHNKSYEEQIRIQNMHLHLRWFFLIRQQKHL